MVRWTKFLLFGYFPPVSDVACWEWIDRLIQFIPIYVSPVHSHLCYPRTHAPLHSSASLSERLLPTHRRHFRLALLWWWLLLLLSKDLSLSLSPCLRLVPCTVDDTPSTTIPATTVGLLLRIEQKYVVGVEGKTHVFSLTRLCWMCVSSAYIYGNTLQPWSCLISTCICWKRVDSCQCVSPWSTFMSISYPFLYFFLTSMRISAVTEYIGYVCICKYMYICVYIYVYIYKYVYICMYMYIYV